MKGIVVGAGGATRELLRRLGEAWDLVVVESDRERLEQARAVRPLQPVFGDGSSRVVLERAGLEDAEALVAASNDDDVNLEICRIAIDAKIHRVVAIAADPERLEDYRELDVPAFSPDSLIARRVEESLESRKISSQTFAQGKAEVIEFEVSHSSPVRGRSLRDLKARSWVVGAILRANDLLIPHGDTVFEAGDVVTVVGAGTDFAEIVRTFTSGQARFPLDYGKAVAISVEKRHLTGAVDEAAYFVRNSRAASLLLVHQDGAAIRGDDELLHFQAMLDTAQKSTEGVEVRTRAVERNPGRAISRLPSEESIGVLVVAPRSGRPGLSLWWAHQTVRLSRKTRRPVLLARGSQPYERIVVPARRSPAGRFAARAAIDLAVQSKAEILAVAAVDPVFIAGPDAALMTRRAIGWLREEAALLGLQLESSIKRGNPVRIFLEATEGADLLVLGVSEHPRSRFQIGVIDHITSRAKCSVLLVPVLE